MTGFYIGVTKNNVTKQERNKTMSMQNNVAKVITRPEVQTVATGAVVGFTGAAAGGALTGLGATSAGAALTATATTAATTAFGAAGATAVSAIASTAAVAAPVIVAGLAVYGVCRFVSWLAE